MTGTWTWATVTQATPLRIKVDGDTTPLDATTDDLVGSLAVDDRVRVHLHADGIIVTGIQGGGSRSNPNLLINSNFMVNQEGNTSGASVAPGAYALDGWKNNGDVVMGSGGLTDWFFSDSAGVRTIVLGKTTYHGFLREIVETRNAPAGTYTLSWGGDVVGALSNEGDAAQLYKVSPITVTLNGTANVNVDLRGASDTVSWVKLEQGSVATPYQPPLYGDNLRACMRYYEKSYNQGTAPGTATSAGSVHGDGSTGGTTSYVGGGARFSVTKRGTPTITLYDLAGASGRVNRENLSISSTTGNAASATQLGDSGFFAYSPSGATAGQIAFHYVADARL